MRAGIGSLGSAFVLSQVFLGKYPENVRNRSFPIQRSRRVADRVAAEALPMASIWPPGAIARLRDVSYGSSVSGVPARRRAAAVIGPLRYFGTATGVVEYTQ